MRLIAHRGYSAIAPENTRAAFDRALQCGATVIECDLQRTRDGHLVVLHDATLNRTTTGRGAVRMQRWQDLRLLSAGYPKKFGAAFSEERLITFEELLRHLQSRARLYAEIKREAILRDGRDRREMIRSVRLLGLVDIVTFISFEWKAIEQMRSMDDDVHLGLLFDRHRPEQMFSLAEKIGARFVMGRVDLVERHPTLIPEAHARGMQLGVYTVDALPRLKKLEALGLDDAATNHIGELLPHFPGDGGEKSGNPG